MLSSRTLDIITLLVREGFHRRGRLIEIITTERYPPGQLDTAEVAAEVDAALAEWRAEQATWPSPTDCDRLDAAFEALRGRGLIALQNAGFTQSDGYEDFQDALERHPNPKTILGYCFYHEQDLERAVKGRGLTLAFGPANPQEEKTRGQEAGEIVREELQRAGLAVEWDGTFGARIRVPNLVWRRRG